VKVDGSFSPLALSIHECLELPMSVFNPKLGIVIGFKVSGEEVFFQTKVHKTQIVRASSRSRE